MDYLENLSLDEIVGYIDSRIASHDYEDLVRLSYYKPTPKMMAYYRAGLNARERLILGGNRTGKTYGVLVELYFHLTGLYPDWWPGYRFNRGINAIEASITAEDTRNILQGILFVGAKDGTVPPIVPDNFILNKTNINLPGAYGTVTFPHVSGDYSVLNFKAYKQGASSFQGIKADWIHLDEHVNYDVYLEALMRTASFSDTRTLMNVTMWPEKGMTETVCHFLNKTEDDGTVSHVEPDAFYKDRFYMHIGWDDNPYMPDAEKERLKNSTPPYLLEARRSGIPIFGHGKVFIQPESEFVIPPFDLSDPKYSHFRYIFGLDPSVTSGGTYGFVLLARDPNTDIIYACSDYKLSNVTPSEHASNIQRLLPFSRCPGKCDPAGVGENPHTKESTFNFLINTCGLNLSKAIKVNGTKESVIDAIYERIRRGTFKILYDASTNSGCHNLMKEWRRYSRDDKGQIIKKDDHCVDACFYGFDGIKNAVSKNQNHYIDRETHASRI